METVEWKRMRRSDKIEWFLRIAVFGSALAVGVIGSFGMWVSTRDYWALLVFGLIFAAVFSSPVYIVRRGKLSMLQT
jgi:hypothetical protein